MPPLVGDELGGDRQHCVRERLSGGHDLGILSHLPAVTEPRPGERCVLCNEPAGKVVLGPIERVSGLRRRTRVHQVRELPRIAFTAVA